MFCRFYSSENKNGHTLVSSVSSIQRFIAECFDHWIDAFLAMIVIIEKKNRWLKLQLYVSNTHSWGRQKRVYAMVKNKIDTWTIWFDSAMLQTLVCAGIISIPFSKPLISNVCANGQALKIGWKNEMSNSARSWHLIVLTTMEKTVWQRRRRNRRISSFLFICSCSLTPWRMYLCIDLLAENDFRHADTNSGSIDFIRFLAYRIPKHCVLLLAHKHMHTHTHTNAQQRPWILNDFFWYK